MAQPGCITVHTQGEGRLRLSHASGEMPGFRILDTIMRCSAITLFLGLGFVSIAVAQHGPAMACTAPAGPPQVTVCADKGAPTTAA